MQWLSAASAAKGAVGGSSGTDVSQPQVKTGAQESPLSTQLPQLNLQQKQGSAQDFINAMLARR